MGVLDTFCQRTATNFLHAVKLFNIAQLAFFKFKKIFLLVILRPENQQIQILLAKIEILKISKCFSYNFFQKYMNRPKQITMKIQRILILGY